MQLLWLLLGWCWPMASPRDCVVEALAACAQPTVAGAVEFFLARQRGRAATAVTSLQAHTDGFPCGVPSCFLGPALTGNSMHPTASALQLGALSLRTGTHCLSSKL